MTHAPATPPTRHHRAAMLPTQGQTHEGLPFTVRPIAVADQPMLVRFHQSLSDETVRLRYFHPVPLAARITPARLARVCRPDPESETVLVAVARIPLLECDQILGVGRLVQASERVAEVATLITDLWQGHGIGTALLTHLIEDARRRAVTDLNAYILRANTRMQRMCDHLGFTVTPTSTGIVRAHLRLK